MESKKRCKSDIKGNRAKPGIIRADFFYYTQHRPKEFKSLMGKHEINGGIK